MQTLKIFVVGPFLSGKTTFMRTVSEIDLVSTERNGNRDKTRPSFYTIAFDFGRLTLSDNTILYFLAPPAIGLRVFQYLNEVEFPISDLAYIVVVDSAYPDADSESIRLIQYIQTFKHPYVVALSKQDKPNARTPQEMREILAIPDDIKVLSYDINKPATTKRVVLELLEICPQDEDVQKAIDGLKARIDEA